MNFRWMGLLVMAAVGLGGHRAGAQTINGYAAMGASETQGTTYTGSWVPYLATDRGLNFGGPGNPYNVAVGGATTSSLLTQGQHTAVRNLVLANQVDLAYLSIGGNDFGPVAVSITTGTLSGDALTAWANQRVTNILTAVDTVLSANPVGMVVMSMPDMALTPSGRPVTSVPLFYERAEAAINLINSILEPQILSRGIVYLDGAQAMRDMNAAPLVVGGVTIDVVNASTDPTHFFQDGLHPAAVGNGMMANIMISAANIGYGTSTPLMTDAQILSRAGLSASYTGETSALDYSRYVRLGTNPALAVASADNGHFSQLSPTSVATTIGQSPNLLTPLDVAHDINNNRYVVDAALSRVVKYDTAGNSSIVADGGDGLLLPTSVAASGGNLYVSNYLTDQILKIDGGGNASVFANSASGLEHPFKLTFDHNGNLYVAEVDSHRIVKFNAQGQMTIFADSTDGLSTPIGLEFDAIGNLYVADAVLSKIFKFDALGNGSVFADISDGALFPTGLAIDWQGNLFVSNYLSDQILKFNSAGVGSVFATTTAGIDGPFGLDFYNAPASSGQSPQSLGIAAVPEASPFLLAGLVALVAMLPAWRKRTPPGFQ